VSQLRQLSLRQHDQLLIVSTLAAIVFLSWWYLVQLTNQMNTMPAMNGMQGMGGINAGLHPWTPTDLLMMFIMWVVMMIAMMVPSAMRMVMIYSHVVAKEKTQDSLITPTLAFALGYVVVWSLFSLVATFLQWGLESAALLSPMMVTTSSSLGAGLLIAAGIYQLTPLKDTCLKYCQSPAMFIVAHYKKGVIGAFKNGLTHGVYCLGCCWLIMGLLFVGGVMNLIWILAISLFVLAEKLLPAKIVTSRITSSTMILAGVVYLATS